MQCDVVVIGAGPAGIMAAGKAALSGVKVVLVDKNPAIGTMMIQSFAQGMAITQDVQRLQFQQKVFAGADFLEQSLKLFSPRKFLLFLEGLGVAVEEKDKGIFLRYTDPSTVRSTFEGWLQRTGVVTMHHSKALRVESSNGVVQGVVVEHDGAELLIKASAVVVATGGVSAPETGSTGDGYLFASAVGHEIVTPRGAMVPLELGDRIMFAPLNGISLDTARLYLWQEGKKIEDCAGKVHFTARGIDGAAVLGISRTAGALAGEEGVSLTLDCLPLIDEGDLEAAFVKQFASAGKEPILPILEKLLPPVLAQFLLTQVAKLSLESKGATITTAQRKTLRAAIKRWPLPLVGAVEVACAQVTVGGVALEGVREETLESYLCAGLFFAGEVLNLDAASSGYNMHIAFATGHLAGENAARVAKEN